MGKYGRILIRGRGKVVFWKMNGKKAFWDLEF